ncbi:DUF7269 family protein [Natronocalculus amylovorans]|uniref:Uncharacterized protein n=1 Tax=Natronocalculus amylovorans TaxID=2917812 RepID=A0AAE3K8W5_9EURY|nr:hypothetical protein [Natronocalculus amylovorans]MCL9817468.1 hypothetical protein [Natronocalculus amylovorans]
MQIDFNLDRDQTIARIQQVGPIAAAVVLLLVGGLLAFFSGPLPSAIADRVITVIPSPVTTVPIVLALLLGLVMSVYLRSGHTDHPGGLVDRDSPPEKPRTAPVRVGASFESTLTEATNTVRLKDVSYQETEPYEQLRETAIERLRLTQTLDREEVVTMLEEGQWTETAVAQAFFAETQAYPPGFQLRRWGEPGAAYQEAIRQTTVAIGQIGTERATEAESDASMTWRQRLASAVGVEATTADEQVTENV